MILDNILKEFDSISLTEIAGVSLMNRVDTKFIFHIDQLNSILLDLKNHYHILIVEKSFTPLYNSLYLDDSNDYFYHEHHRGRNNRFKIRYRHYVDSEKLYFEIKHKKHGRTLKQRILSDTLDMKLSNKQLEFIRNSSAPNLKLQDSLSVSYNRITLVSKKSIERVTIDVNLSFTSRKNSKKISDIAIAELKQEKISRDSPYYNVMKERYLLPFNLSKYVLGRITLSGETPIKHNRFKNKLLQLNKIRNNEYNLVRS